MHTRTGITNTDSWFILWRLRLSSLEEGREKATTKIPSPAAAAAAAAAAAWAEREENNRTFLSTRRGGGRKKKDRKFP